MTKVLFAYGTRYGATTNTVALLSKFLQTHGIITETVDLKKKHVDDIAAYDMIVIGSGIKTSKWVKEVEKFIEDNVSTLRKKNLALFVSSASWPLTEPNGPFSEISELSKASELSVTKEEASKLYIMDICEKYSIEPKSTMLFGGVWDFKRMGGFWRALLGGFRKDLESRGIDTSTPYDNRSIERIREWSEVLLNLVN